jgi:hypothetical protein
VGVKASSEAVYKALATRDGLRPAERVLWQVVDGPVEWIGTKVSFDLKQEGEYAVVLFKHLDWKEPGGKGAPSPGDVQISNWH